MAKCVPVQETSFSNEEFVSALIAAWNSIYGQLPQKEQIGVIFAQWSHETGQGKHCHNFNIGNVKYIPSNSGIVDNSIEYMMLPNVWEMVNGKKVIFNPPDQQTWFRSFNTLADGTTFQLNVLINKRYKKAWSAVVSGNPNEFAHLLKLAGYYTDTELNYSKGLNLYFNKFMKDNSFENAIKSFKSESPKNAGELLNLSNEDDVPIGKSFWQTIPDLISNIFTKK